MSDHPAVTEAEHQCTRLSHAYARAVDFRDYEALEDVFTANGALVLPDGNYEGVPAIYKRMKQRPDELRSRHIVSNVFVDLLSPEEARGISYLTLYEYEGSASITAGPVPLTGPALVGHFEDRFVLTQTGWRIVRRRLHVAFSRASTPD